VVDDLVPPNSRSLTFDDNDKEGIEVTTQSFKLIPELRTGRLHCHHPNLPLHLHLRLPAEFTTKGAAEKRHTQADFRSLQNQVKRAMEVGRGH